MPSYNGYKQSNMDFNSISKIQPVKGYRNYAIRTTLAVMLPSPLAAQVKRKS